MKRFLSFFAQKSQVAAAGAFRFFGIKKSAPLAILTLVYGTYNYLVIFGSEVAKQETLKLLWGTIEPVVFLFLVTYVFFLFKELLPNQSVRIPPLFTRTRRIFNSRFLSLIFLIFISISCSYFAFIGYRLSITSSSIFLPPPVVTASYTPSSTNTPSPAVTYSATPSETPTFTVTPTQTPTPTNTPWLEDSFISGELNKTIWEDSSCEEPLIVFYVDYVSVSINHHKVNQCWINVRMKSSNNVLSLKADLQWIDGISDDGYMGIHSSCGLEKILFLFDNRSVGYQRTDSPGWNELFSYVYEKPVKMTLQMIWTESNSIELSAYSTNDGSLLAHALIPCLFKPTFVEIGGFLVSSNYDLVGSIDNVEIIDK
jgi:hypothetical protein